MTLEETFEDIMRRVIREEMKVMADDDRLLTAEQVAELLGYSDVHSVYQLKRENRIQGVYLTPKALRFRNSDVQRLIRDLAA